MIKKIVFLALVAVVVAGIGFTAYWLYEKEPFSPKVKVDDWAYDSSASFTDKIKSAANYGGTAMQTAMSPMGMSNELGFAVGGAKDVNNFRENIKNNFLPLPTDLTYEGLFYDYYFDTGKQKDCDELFCPSYSYAVSPDPVSGVNDYYLAVGLNSGIKENDFNRKKLNLVVVLDISGSMSSPFNQYYYDQFGNQVKIEDNENATKIEVAKESLKALTEHLNKDDRFGLVLFDDEAFLAKPLNLVEETDMDAIRDHLDEIEANNGTYMSGGMKMATEMFNELKNVDQDEYENRIIFLTDAMPNIGETGRDSLMGITQDNAANKLYSTFIGIGVDFNTDLIDSITKIRGANYYSVHSSKEFTTRMDDEFDFMVTPLVFNLELKLQTDGYSIEKVYGSPEADEATGEIMKVNTLFPSKTSEGETRGGLVLLKLKKLRDNADMKLTVTYENRAGKSFETSEDIKIEKNETYYANSGIRKGIVLARYADLMKNWMIDERSHYQKPEPWYPVITEKTGLMCPPPFPVELGEWERQSAPLNVSDGYKKLFIDFKTYFDQEKSQLNDATLDKESEILETLIKM
jgi:Ca-activated chloride channel homolog